MFILIDRCLVVALLFPRGVDLVTLRLYCGGRSRIYLFLHRRFWDSVKVVDGDMSA